ncbi:MAG: phosphoribosylanthranilate isomerase [Ancalomicrobiaceae bacterium]|nr:phosphoribosylanthranilate isomerase [Ancalomicrobiaceae bacterium]
MALDIKICGLTTEDAVAAALAGGADLIGFVFFPKSPRNVDVALARSLAAPARGRAQIVALTVDASDALISDIARGLEPDLLQVHGAETPERVAEIRARFAIPVMKALKIAGADDLAAISRFEPVVDRLLFDAKPPATLVGALPGGNGISFDWRLIAGLRVSPPTMLSGGLDADNVAEAIRLTGIAGVDVSSGVERRPGDKDPALIARFIAAARRVERAAARGPEPAAARTVGDIRRADG